MSLNHRQERFCRELVKCGIRAEAARRAGYSEANAKVHGSRLMLTNAKVRQRVDDLEKELREVEKLTPEKIKAGILKEAKGANQSRDRLTAWQHLAKIEGMMRDVREVREVGKGVGALEPATILSQLTALLGDETLAIQVAVKAGIPLQVIDSIRRKGSDSQQESTPSQLN